MRLVPINNAIDSIIAEDVYDLSGRILLKKETKLTSSFANRIKNIGYASIYIKDKFGLPDVNPLIPTELKFSALNAIRNLHALIRQPQSKGLKIHESIDDIFKLAKIMEYELNARRKNTIDYIDIKSSLTYSYEHSIAVGMLSFLLSKSLGYNPQELTHIFVGALFHDVGMAYIDETVFMKNGKLNLEEFVKIKEHPQKGYNFIKDLPQFSAYTKVIALQHHEKLDGSGYPNKLVANDIHPYARIVSVCDIYDAMSSDRPYSPAVEPTKVLEYLDSASNSQLDSINTLHFMRILMPYPEGTIVRLSNNELAVIIANEELWPLSPMVQLIDASKKTLISTQIKLMDTPSITIAEVVYDIV